MTMRSAIAAVLTLQVALIAQGGAKPAENPFANSPYWTFSLSGATYRDTLRRASSADPLESIPANFALGSKLAAVRSAAQLLTASPDRLAAGIRLLIERSHDLNDDGTTLQSELLAFVDGARRRVATLSGEDGAEAASAMLDLENIVDPERDYARRQQRIDAFLAKYSGTAAAAVVRVGNVEANPYDRDFEGRLNRFRQLAREYDRTDAGAMALYLLAFRQANPSLPGPDPTDRILEVFDIVKLLESGRFPRSRWTENPAKLVHGIYFGLTTDISPANMRVLYAKYFEFGVAHPDGLDGTIRNAVGRLAPTPIERGAVVEEYLEDLEKAEFGINNVRLLRAQFYLPLTDPEWVSDHLKGAVEVKEAEDRAIRNLRAVRESSDEAAAARASVMLAGHYLKTKRYVEARSYYQGMISKYPDTAWAWLPMFHVAQITEILDPTRAVTAYEELASRRNLPAGAVLLSRIAAAELRETQGDLTGARVHYRAALDAWASFPERPFVSVARGEFAHLAFSRFNALKKSEVSDRLDRLSRAVSTEDALLYEGRRAIESNRSADAIVPLQKLIDGFSRSTAAIEGRRLLRRAQFNELLAKAQDRGRLEQSLDELTREPYDSVTTLAKLARAAVMVRSGARTDAETKTRQALEEWHKRQATPADLSSPLSQDIAAIRAELFRPQGGGVFGTRGGNAFEWPKTMPPFAIVPRDVQIVTGDGKQQRVTALFTAKMDAMVLFATYEELSSMRMILDMIGGTETAEWTMDPSAAIRNGVMDVPNQPIGGSTQIAALWSTFFPMRPGHWGGWELTIYPYVTKITFDRDAHALADYTLGYSGGTVELLKENGVWVAKRIVSFWIT